MISVVSEKKIYELAKLFHKITHNPMKNGGSAPI